jgi:hypothetical protein
MLGQLLVLALFSGCVAKETSLHGQHFNIVTVEDPPFITVRHLCHRSGHCEKCTDERHGKREGCILNETTKCNGTLSKFSNDCAFLRT